MTADNFQIDFNENDEDENCTIFSKRGTNRANQQGYDNFDIVYDSQITGTN